MTAEPLDVVIPVRPGDHNEELRYALRSIAANLPHHRVWIAGHTPSWATGVRHIPVEHDPGATRWANSRANRAAACAHPDVADTFALWNDDMFLMRPVAELPVWHLGPMIARYNPVPRPPGIRQYMNGLLATDTWLRKRGIDHPLSYEAHVPLVVDRAGFGMALRMAECIDTDAPHVRSIYGNLAGIGGEHHQDVKIANATTLPADALFISSDDVAFDVGLVGDVVRTAFPAPCRYELQAVPA